MSDDEDELYTVIFTIQNLSRSMRVEEVSAGYYLTEVMVQPGTDRPKVNDRDYHDLRRTVHDEDTDTAELICQMDETIFEVTPSRTIPQNVLQLPVATLEQTRIRHPPEKRGVKLPKPWFYKYLREPDVPRNEVL